MQQDWSANLQVFLLVRTTSQNARLGKSTPNTQDRKFQEKLNPFHGRFTVRSIRFRLAKQIDIWIKINSCCSCIQNLKNLLTIMQFCLWDEFLFSSIFLSWVLSIRCHNQNQDLILLTLMSKVHTVDNTSMNPNYSIRM